MTELTLYRERWLRALAKQEARGEGIRNSTEVMRLHGLKTVNTPLYESARIDLVERGLIHRKKGCWWLTEAGRKASAFSFPPVAAIHNELVELDDPAVNKAHVSVVKDRNKPQLEQVGKAVNILSAEDSSVLRNMGMRGVDRNGMPKVHDRNKMRHAVLLLDEALQALKESAKAPAGDGTGKKYRRQVSERAKEYQEARDTSVKNDYE